MCYLHGKHKNRVLRFWYDNWLSSKILAIGGEAGWKVCRLQYPNKGLGWPPSSPGAYLKGRGDGIFESRGGCRGKFPQLPEKFSWGESPLPPYL